MRHARRVSPSMVVAALALFVALGGSAFAVGSKAKPVLRCGNGSVKAYAAFEFDSFAGAFPQQFSSSADLFAARFSCNGQSPQFRATGHGRYEVRFPGIASGAATASVLSSRGGSLTWRRVGDTYQIAVIDPSGNPTDRGFSIAVF